MVHVPEHFIDDDPGYLAWLRDHPTGFVINSTRHPTASYLVLHRAECWTINGTPSRGVSWTTDLRKVCADSKGDLAAWARSEVGGEPYDLQRHLCGALTLDEET